MSDYLAIIQTNGIGSWARDWERSQAISNVIRMFHSDWKTILKPEGKATIKIKVYDIEGYDEVVWGDEGMFGDGKKLDIKPEIIEHTYDKW